MDGGTSGGRTPDRRGYDGTEAEPVIMDTVPLTTPDRRPFVIRGSQCAWCGAGTVEGKSVPAGTPLLIGPEDGVSHGICLSCLARELASIRRTVD